MKSKKLLLLGLVFVLVVLALSTAASAALGDMVKGNGTKIIVNVVVIGAAFYLTLPLLGKKAETPQGNNAMIFIAIILAIVLALNVVPRGQFIWETNLLKGFFDVLKNPTRLGILVGATAVFLWLFTSLEIGGGAEKGFANKLNFVLALVIGYHLASRDPISVAMVVRAGELIGLLVIYRNLEKSVGDNKVLAAGLAAFIVFWISAITFPDYALLGEKNLWKMGFSLGSIALQVGIIVAVFMFSRGQENKGLKWGLPAAAVALMFGMNFIPGLKEYGLFSGLKSIFFILALVGIGAATMFGGKADAKFKGLKTFAQYAVWNRVVQLIRSRFPRLADWLLLKESLRAEGEAELQNKLKDDIPALVNFANRLAAATNHRVRLHEVHKLAQDEEAKLDIYLDKAQLWKEIREFEFGEEGYKQIEDEIEVSRREAEKEKSEEEKQDIETRIRQKLTANQGRLGWKKLLELHGYYSGVLSEYETKFREESAKASKEETSMIVARWQNRIENMRTLVNGVESTLKKKKDHWDALREHVKQHNVVERIVDSLDADDIPTPRYKHPYYLTKRFLHRGELKSEIEVDENGYVMMDIWEEQDLRLDFRIYHYVKKGVERLLAANNGRIVKKTWVPNAFAWQKNPNIAGSEIIEDERVYTREVIDEKIPPDLYDLVGIGVDNRVDRYINETFTSGKISIVLRKHNNIAEIKKRLKTFRKSLAEFLLMIENSQLEMIKLDPRELFKWKDAEAYNLVSVGDQFRVLEENRANRVFRFSAVKEALTEIHEKIKPQIAVATGSIEIRPADRAEMEKQIKRIDLFLNDLPFRWVPSIEASNGNPFDFWFYHLKWSETFQHMIEEYTKWMDDFKDGRYRGVSRTLSDYYSVALRHFGQMFKGKNDLKIAFTTAPSSRLPALDRRCILSEMVEKWRFWGRRAWWTQDDGEMGWSRNSPDPTTSLRAINQFITNLLDRNLEDKEKARLAARKTLRLVEEELGKPLSSLKEEGAQGGSRT